MVESSAISSVIKIRRDTKKGLDKIKIHYNETYSSVISRILEKYLERRNENEEKC